MEKIILGRPVGQWFADFPLLADISQAREVFWANPGLESTHGRPVAAGLTLADISQAQARLARFAPYLAKAFPETAANGGLIESPLKELPAMKAALSQDRGQLPGALYLKCDGHLPISGSVKARGGIYEVLKTAEDIALANGALSLDDNYAAFDEPGLKKLLSEYSIVVGSTGNLGLSIGIMSARLGFKVVVHMSADAKQWKKDKLRAHGAVVVEHAGDYGQAVAQGRREAEAEPRSHFVDDENSQTLFLGYAVAALRLEKQLAEAGLKVDGDHPLFVYLPCGVGGAPGGITFGLRTVFGDHAHCFYAEPTHSPAMLLGLMTGRHNDISVADFGLDNKTEADGLAVGRPSGFVGRALAKDISGGFTVDDDELFRLLARLAEAEQIYLEPSALAGFPGPWHLAASPRGRDYLEKWSLADKLNQATHVVWATGGGMVPPDIMQGFYERGRALLAS